MSCSVLSAVVALFIFMMPLGQCERVIYVTKSDAAIDNTSCWSGGEFKPCNNLTLALGGVVNNTAIVIESDYSPYQLDPSHFSTFKNVDFIRLESNGKGQAEVHCSSGAGLSFFSVSNIVIMNITFLRCGVLHNSTSKNFNSTETGFLTFNVGLYFLGCANVTIEGVFVTQSIGIAVQFYATHGENSILNSNFTNNDLTDKNGLSGAVYIEFPYCLPDSFPSCPPVDPVLVSGATFSVRSCVFTYNKASTNYDIPRYVSRNESNYQFGKGGGLSLSFKGSSSFNKVQIINCSFSANVAKKGGAVYVDFQDQVSDNAVEISGIDVKDCIAQIGGAIAMLYYKFNHKIVRNTVSINSSNFTSNEASLWGGAVSLYVTRQTDSTNQLILTECTFDFNTGAFGAAASFSLYYSSPKGQGSLIIPVLDSCRFMNNVDTKVKGSQELAQFGAVYANLISVQFRNKVDFFNNSGSGVVAVSAELEFAESTASVFIENNAVHGAGISLLANSAISLGRNTSYHFENNSATLYGGAIYSISIGERTAISQNCFLQYQDFDVPPEDWLVKFVFINNTVVGKNDSLANATMNTHNASMTNTSNNGYDTRRLNSIYSQSIIPCLWKTIHSNPTFNLTLRRQVFCWNKTAWQYASHECWREIQTAVAELKIPSILQVTPDNDTKMGISAVDDLENDVTDYLVLSAQSTTSSVGIDRNYHYISSNTIKLLHFENNDTNSTYSIHLQTLPQRVLEAQLNISFNNCTAGLQLKGGHCSFVGNYGNYLRFNSITGYAEIFREYWIGLRPDGNEVVAFCLFCNGFSNKNPSGGYIPLNFTTTDNYECSVSRRKGFLCSECKDNLSLSIFSIDKQCKGTSSVYNGIVWTVFVVVHLIYYVLLAVFIIVTNISFTAAPLNSAIIFAQMVTTVVDVTAGGIINLGELKTIRKVYTCLYDLFNLNLFHTLFHHLTISIPLPLAKILLTILPLLPLLVVIVCWVIIFCILHKNKDFFDCKERGSKIAICCYVFEVKEALRNTLGSFLLLSSTTVLIVLIQLMHPTFLYSSDYKIVDTVFYLDPGSPFKAGHFYVLLPLFIILFVLAPFLLFLICCRYRPEKLKASQGQVVIDNILEPLQSHFKRYELETKESCIGVNENPESNNNLVEEEKEDKKLNEECPYKVSCGWLRLPPCCSGLVYFSFNDFHWVPAGFIILRVILIVIYNYSWDYGIRCMMQLVAVMVTAALIAIYRPYKSDWINSLDTFIFLDLGLLIGLSSYQFHISEINLSLSIWVYVVQLILIFIPFIWITLYIGARVAAGIMNACQKKSCLKTRTMHTQLSSKEEIDSSNEGRNSPDVLISTSIA